MNKNLWGCPYPPGLNRVKLFIISVTSELRTSFKTKVNSVNKTNFAQNFMNFVVDAIVFAVVLGILFLISCTDKVI